MLLCALFSKTERKMGAAQSSTDPVEAPTPQEAVAGAAVATNDEIEKKNVNIYYGSEWGSCEKLAHGLAKSLNELGES